jgi:hypothetical protein
MGVLKWFLRSLATQCQMISQRAIKMVCAMDIVFDSDKFVVDIGSREQYPKLISSPSPLR